MSSDEDLLKRFIAGDRPAFGELAQRHEVALLNLARAMLGSRERAMDAVQETWVRVIRNAGTFRGWAHRGADPGAAPVPAPAGKQNRSRATRWARSCEII